MHKSENKITLKRPIAFIGMPGSGKSTIGKGLAASLGRVFIDSDALIVQRAEMSIPEIFETQGEQAFRTLEKEMIVSVTAQEDMEYVLSTGGGAPATPEILEALKERTLLIYIQASIEVLWARLDQTSAGRPMLNSDDPRQQLEKLLADRQHVYEQAEIIIESDGLSEQDLIQIIQTKISELKTEQT